VISLSRGPIEEFSERMYAEGPLVEVVTSTRRPEGGHGGENFSLTTPGSLKAGDRQDFARSGSALSWGVNSYAHGFGFIEGQVRSLLFPRHRALEEP
jgi:hypothetical protein